MHFVHHGVPTEYTHMAEPVQVGPSWFLLCFGSTLVVYLVGKPFLELQ